MPEIKNTFLAGKMNKSLDDRIIPQGEYRDALNVQVTKAEGPDVGVMHNIEGNELAHTSLSLDAEYETIGSFFDEKNNIIYWFVTNNGTSDNSHRIYKWDKSSGTATLIVQGSYLNFNKANKITGVNLLEDLLFWTDGLNQPRRINVTRANGSYYDSEVKVSVAKYAPYLPPQITSTTASDFYDENITSKRIEEEFVRFAYRYKFKDNEYSIISPFTPISFRMSNNIIDTSGNAYQTSDLFEIAKRTFVPEMINGVNRVPMSIPLPTGTTGPTTDYEIQKIEILYKESDSNAIRIIDILDISDSDGDSKDYVYKSSNFKSTLPEDQLTRVFDDVPLKAQAQEVAGNRVIYGNITKKQDLPEVNFSVTYSPKIANEYIIGNQSVKQRRTYEVGIVLCDIFGRTSPVILDDTSTITVDAKNQDFDNSVFDGDSLKLLFTTLNGNGTLYNEITNPTGWYSYRVVVKQKEQEYYNAYVPGVWNNGSLVSYFVIHGDNINKLPRETVNKDEDDLFSPSSVRVYPKVLNIASGTGQTFVRSYKNSDFRLLDIVDIGKINDFGFNRKDRVFEYSKNHLIGKVETLMGTIHGSSRSGGDFAVLETEPFESALDIYYETPTTGLISDVVTGINDYEIDTAEPVAYNLLGANNHGPHDQSNSDYLPELDFSESNTVNKKVADLYVKAANGDEIPGSFTEITLEDQTTPNRYGVRLNRAAGRWEVYLNEPFVYQYSNNDDSPDNGELYLSSQELNVTVNFLGQPVDSGASFNLYVIEKNAEPQCTGPSQFSFDGTTQSTTTPIFKVFGTSGSNKRDDSVSPNHKEGLTFEFVKITQTHTDTQGDQDVYVHYDEEQPTSNNTNKFKFIDPVDGQVDSITTDDGFAEIFYVSQTQHHNDGDTFEFKIRVSENGVKVSEIFSATPQDNTQDFEGNTVTCTAVTYSGDVSNSDTTFSNQLYYAETSSFANAYVACQTPIGSPEWSQATIYYPGDVDPFVVEQEGGVVPGRMYDNEALTIAAPLGWYKRTDTGVIGYYSAFNVPAGGQVWWYETPAYCATLTEEDAENAMSYSPPEDNDLPFDEPRDDDPYGLTPVPDENIP